MTEQGKSKVTPSHDYPLIKLVSPRAKGEGASTDNR